MTPIVVSDDSSPAPPLAMSEQPDLSDWDGALEEDPWGAITARRPIDIHLDRFFSKWLSRPNAQEVAINRPGEVVTWENGLWVSHQDVDMTPSVIEQLGRLIANMTRKPFNAGNPTLSASLPDGTRVEMTCPPATVSGHTYVNLRKHSVQAFTLDQFFEQGYFKDTVHQFNPNLQSQQRNALLNQLLPEQRELWEYAQTGDWGSFLRRSVLSYQNILVSGATGSGKTSFIRGLVEEIPRDERILTVEDTPEMPLPNHPNSNALLYRREGTGQAGASAKELLQAAMRKTPKRVLLAELRGDETYYYIQSVLNSGHPGGMTTTHANSPREAFVRLALLIKASVEGRGLELAEIRSLLNLLVHVVVQIVFDPEKGRYSPSIYYDPLYAMTLW